MEEQQPATGVPEPSQKPPEEQKKDDTSRLFDSRRHVNLTLPPPEEKNCKVRFPTDQEWIDHSRTIKLVRHELGRGRSTSDIQGAEQANLKLFEKIREDDGAPFDEWEASEVIEGLTVAESQAAKVNGAGYRIPLTVLGEVVTVHTLRIPTIKERRKYDRASAARIRRGSGDIESKGNLEVIGAFYDTLTTAQEGYVPESTVPLAHKQEVVLELTTALADLEVQADPLN